MRGRKYTQEEYIAELEKAWGDRYIYDRVVYLGSDKRIEIGCRKHGYFWQRANAHLRIGQGCKFCTREKITRTLDEFIIESRKLYGDKYIFDEKSKYVNSYTPIIIKCPKHGYFPVLPQHYLNGQECKECTKIKSILKRRLTLPEVIERFRNKHPEKTKDNSQFKYDYSEVEYNGMYVEVKCICNEVDSKLNKHGEFWITPSNHLCGSGCPRCSSIFNKKEQELKDFIKSLNIEFKENDRKILEGKELDIYIPKKNLAIEFNGIVFHSELYNRDKDFHYQKSLKCNLSGIKLIYIWEHLWDNEIKKDVIKSIIKQNLGLNKNINSDDCVLKLIDFKDCDFQYKTKIQLFFEYNNIYEYDYYNYCLVLEYNEEIYQVILLTKILDYWELQEVVTKNNYNIIGGFNKLLNYFIKEFKPKQILYKLDYNYFDKTVFDKLDIKPQFKQYIYDSWNYGELISNESEKYDFEVYNADYNIFLWENISY